MKIKEKCQQNVINKIRDGFGPSLYRFLDLIAKNGRKIDANNFLENQPNGSKKNLSLDMFRSKEGSEKLSVRIDDDSVKKDINFRLNEIEDIEESTLLRSIFMYASLLTQEEVTPFLQSYNSKIDNYNQTIKKTYDSPSSDNFKTQLYQEKIPIVTMLLRQENYRDNLNNLQDFEKMIKAEAVSVGNIRQEIDVLNEVALEIFTFIESNDTGKVQVNSVLAQYRIALGKFIGESISYRNQLKLRNEEFQRSSELKIHEFSPSESYFKALSDVVTYKAEGRLDFKENYFGKEVSNSFDTASMKHVQRSMQFSLPLEDMGKFTRLSKLKDELAEVSNDSENGDRMKQIKDEMTTLEELKEEVKSAVSVEKNAIEDYMSEINPNWKQTETKNF
ncbi:hypothetical protein OAB57_01715 [Bacteriovoracaceae bacterium]|nr:hypothetical protein [Bacteriovoracaceae bacterium]